MTPGAVGQLIHKLEDWLQVRLFHREIRKVSLTEAGAAYFGRISIALGQISHASFVLKQRRHNEVRISMPPSFARKWFVPRMAGFMGLHPDVNLHIDTTSALVDFDKEPIDLAVRHFSARQSGKFDIELLFLDELRVYCTPEYRQKLGLKQPADFAKATLLAARINPYWKRWLRQFSQLSDQEIEDIPTIDFDASHLAVDTAMRHHGVVLTSAPLVEREIANGDLIEPFEAALSVDEGYYLVGPKGSFALDGAAQALRLWLRQEGRVSQ